MSEPLLNKKTLEHLAELARIELDSKEEEKLLKDLGNILAYFEELRSLDTKGVRPLRDSGSKNVFREDTERTNTNRGAGVELFPAHEDGFLKIPPVFSAEGGSASGGE